MNILLAGKLDSIGAKLVDTVNGHKVVLSGRNINDFAFQKKVQTFDISPEDPLFRRVFDACSVEAVVFFLARGEHADKREGGLDAFQNVLGHCSDAGVKLVILVSSGEVYSGLPDYAGNAQFSQNLIPYGGTYTETTPPAPRGAQGFVIKAAEDLCLHYKSDTGGDVAILRMPYIYARGYAGASANERAGASANGRAGASAYARTGANAGGNASVCGDGLIGRMLASAAENRICLLPGGPDAPCDFLSDEDAARLIILIIDEGFTPDSSCVNVGSEKPSTFGAVAAMLTRMYHDIKIKYSGDWADIPPPMRNESAKTEYGWIPLYNLADDFPGLKAASIRGGPEKRRLLAAFFGWKGFIFIEFISVAALVYALSVGLKGFSLAYWIDFRFLLVVMMGMMHGTVAGIAAAAVASAMLFFTHGGYSPQLFLYNTENWIPFAFYIIVGTVLGNSADKQKENRKTIDEKLALADITTRRLTDLCNAALREKDEYRDQVLGYKENYGRIYAIVQKLNSETAENVLSSAVDALADVLENDAVAIYEVSDGEKYARLAVRAKGFPEDFPRSAALDDYRRMMETVLRREIWFNHNLLPGYPAYCAPVYNGSRLIALIVVQHAAVGQLTLNYHNLLKIMSGLIQDFLVNAIKIKTLRQPEIYYPGTRIMRKEAFTDALKAHIALAEQEKAEFELIVLRMAGTDMETENGILENCFRESDLYGMINKRLIGVILRQAYQESAGAVQERLLKSGMSARPVSIQQMQEFIYNERGDII